MQTIQKTHLAGRSRFSQSLRRVWLPVFMILCIIGFAVQMSSVSVRAAQADTVLELYKGKADVNEKFQAQNMLPGDELTKVYAVKVNHKADLTLFFNTEITEQTQSLGDALNIKVTRLGTEKNEVLYDGSFSEMQGKEFSQKLTKNDQGETVVYYEITVSADTSMGNEYQGAKLLADFNWYTPDDGSLTPPQTGEDPLTWVWVALGVSAVAIVVFLVVKVRKGEKSHG